VQPTVEQRWPGCPSPVTRPAADYAPVSGCDVEAVLLIPSLDADQAAKAPDQAVDVASQGCIDSSRNSGETGGGSLSKGSLRPFGR
jgi:hypothetical protein